jgi:CheY-like chemotaxis protein
MIEESHPLPEKTAPRAPGRTRRAKSKVDKTKVNLALDKKEAAAMVERIRVEVDYHRGCAAEIKAKLEKLTGVAFEELLKVKELKSIVESLKESGKNGGCPLAGPGDSNKEWKQKLDRELEKLLIIKRLLEDSLAQARPEESRPPEAADPSRAKKILVVDDDPTTVKIISHFLQKENYRVSSSLAGVDGIKKAFKENPDLILLDIMIPDLDGFQFLSIFRKDPEYAKIPVIILSSLAEEADVLKGLEIGAVDYLTKPFSPQVLMAKIKKNLNSPP